MVDHWFILQNENVLSRRSQMDQVRLYDYSIKMGLILKYNWAFRGSQLVSIQIYLYTIYIIYTFQLPAII